MPPKLSNRIAIALGVAALCGATTYGLTIRYPWVQGLDFTWHWRAARVLLEHGNPYHVIHATDGYPLSSGYYYPLPAALLALPLAWLRANIAAAVMVAVASGTFAFALTRDGYQRLPLLMSAPMASAVFTAQIAPLMAAGCLIPALQFLAPAKPTLGAAAFAGRPSWAAIVGGAISVVVSFVLVPSWVSDWIAQVRADPGVHLIPVMVPGGFLMLLTVLRYRVAEARTLLVMSLVPQTMTYYDPLPVVLCARTFRESLIIALLSQCAMVGTLKFDGTLVAGPAMFRAGAPFALWSIYIPALVMVLRRNSGRDSVRTAEQLPPTA